MSRKAVEAVASEEVQDTAVEETPAVDPAVDESGAGSETESQDTTTSDDRPFTDVDKFLLESGMAKRARQVDAEARKPVEPQPKAPEPEPFDVKLDPTVFSGVDEPEKVAEAVTNAIKAVHQSWAGRYGTAEQKIAALEAELRETSGYVQKQRQADPYEVLDAVRKELPDTYKEFFPTAARRIPQGTEEWNRADALLSAMAIYAAEKEAATGKRPALDAKLAEKVIAMSNDSDGPLANLYTKAQRKKIQAGINGAAKGATAKTSQRRAGADEKLTPDQIDKQLAEYARKVLPTG